MEKLTIMEVNNIVNEEGIGYAALYHVHSGDIGDENLAKLWREVFTAIVSVNDYLSRNYRREED